MGEWSKTVGEFGEQTVANFLKIIGWTNAPSNLEIRCLNPESHSDSGSRSTHGIDFNFSYKSPLIDGVLKNVCVSVKYTSNKYPSSPSSTFKAYFQDLVYAIECFANSEMKRNITSHHTGVESIEDVGVIFWLSNDVGTYDDMISKVAGIQTLTSNKVNSILLVDNKRIEFIYSAIRFAKYKFPNHEIDFFYPSTGKNIIPTTKQSYGKILPVEYINASIIPIRIENMTSGNVHLLLFTIDLFSTMDLKRLIGLSQELCGSWTSSVYITFPDYDELLHKNEVRIVQSSFENKQIVKNLLVDSYKDNFKSI
jgi:hypothetical protein